MSKNLSAFFADYPLYTKLEVANILEDVELIGCTFQSYCSNDGIDTTFEIVCEDREMLARKGRLQVGIANVLSNSIYDIDFTQHYIGECQFCKKSKKHFLINVFTERDIHGEKKFYVRKVGQLPAPETNLDSSLVSFLTPEDNAFYKKALLNLQYGYGVGAFAYFRRIVQNEIESIATKLVNTNPESQDSLLRAIENYRQNKAMKNLINDITPFLPKRIIDIGNNPLLVLYAQLSDGIHNLTEEECVERSNAIDKLMRFVIQELRNENDLHSAKDALKQLTKKN